MRLKTIIKKIYVLEAMEIELTKQKTFIESCMEGNTRARRSLDVKLESGLINSEAWALKTDAIDEMLIEDEISIENLERQISLLQNERQGYEVDLENYTQEEIRRIKHILELV